MQLSPSSFFSWQAVQLRLRPRRPPRQIRPWRPRQSNKPLPPLLLPPLQGIDEEALLTEAGAINYDIDLQLGEIAYFGNHKTSTDRVVALGSRKKEAGREELLLAESATDKEIDKLLNQVINEY